MKAKLKKLVPYILIILAVILLGIVVAVVLQFNKKGENIDLRDPVKPVEEKTYNFVNNSSLDEIEIMNIIESRRDDIIGYFDPIKYYKLTDVEPSFTEDDNEKYMVLTNDFTDSLKFMVTSTLYDKLTANFEILKEDNGVTYYKVLKDEFTPLHTYSAIAMFNFLEKEIHPIYATEDRIESVVRLKICDDALYENVCRRDDDYKFVLVNKDNSWLIDDIGYDFNEQN